jgi:tetratricopeptide (TPR) repeat protein
MREALEIRERELPDGTAPVRNARYQLAECEVGRGRFAEAVTLLRRELDRPGGTAEETRGELEALLATALVGQGNPTAALEITRQWIGADVSASVKHEALRAHAHALRATGDRDGAVEALRQAVALEEPGMHDARVVAMTRLELADLLLARGDERGARAQVSAAIDFMDEVEDRGSVAWRELHAWLQQHPG